MTTSQKGVIFLDSSVILRYFLGDSTAKDIIEGSSRFAINVIVFSEVSFNLLKLLYIEKYRGYRFYDMKSSLSMLNYDILKGYKIFNSFLDELSNEDRLVFLPITMEVVKEASEIAIKYGLLPNDSLIVATCRHYGIDTIATFDEDFKRIPWLKVIP
ncbi:MAG: PIN domain-containing protein [Desulfurococcales archaeon]|nr:PIN domain-containing protein [Desulfurococcales archaeon]